MKLVFLLVIVSIASGGKNGEEDRGPYQRLPKHQQEASSSSSQLTTYNRSQFLADIGQLNDNGGFIRKCGATILDPAVDAFLITAADCTIILAANKTAVRLPGVAGYHKVIAQEEIPLSLMVMIKIDRAHDRYPSFDWMTPYKPKKRNMFMKIVDPTKWTIPWRDNTMADKEADASTIAFTSKSGKWTDGLRPNRFIPIQEVDQLLGSPNFMAGESTYSGVCILIWNNKKIHFTRIGDFTTQIATAIRKIYEKH